MKLGCLKGKKLTGRIFEKKSYFGDNAQKHSKIRFFWILQQQQQQQQQKSIDV